MARIANLPKGMRDRFAYVSHVRYHRPDYPYRIALEADGRELVLYHLAIVNNKWEITHGVALKRTDLTKMLKATKK